MRVLLACAFVLTWCLVQAEEDVDDEALAMLVLGRCLPLSSHPSPFGPQAKGTAQAVDLS